MILFHIMLTPFDDREGAWIPYLGESKGQRSLQGAKTCDEYAKFREKAKSYQDCEIFNLPQHL